MCAKQNISLPFRGFQSGKPIANIDALSVLWKRTSIGRLQRATKAWFPRYRQTLTKDGVITVTVPVPTPEHVTISSLDTVNPVEAELSIPRHLKTGTIVPYRKGSSTLRPSVKAGRCPDSTRKLTALDRVSREVP